MAETRTTNEPEGIRPGAVILAVGALVLMLAIVLAIVAAVFRFERGGWPGMAARDADKPYKGPQLETDPRTELAAVRAAEDRRLHADAALPIEQAMRAVAARGAKAFDPWIAAPKAPP